MTSSQKGTLNENEARKYMKQIISAIHHCHTNNIMHRDLKPDNIMLASPDTLGIKLIDFGSACRESKTRENAQCRYYRAPEVLSGQLYGNPVDLWSIGCILVELHTGRPLFPGRNKENQLFKIEKMFRTEGEGGAKRSLTDFVLKYSVWGENIKKFVDLVGCLLEYDPEKRLSASQALAHPFFGDLVDILPSHSREKKSGKEGFGSPVSNISTGESFSPFSPVRLSTGELEAEEGKKEYL